MDVRHNAESEDMTQALTHNLSTVQRDLEMVIPILKARGEKAAERTAKEALKHLTESYELMLKTFGDTLVVTTHSSTRTFHTEIGVFE